MFLYAGFISVKNIFKLTVLNSKLLDYLLLMSLICFVGFRYYCDNDYTNYVTIYDAVPSIFNVTGVLNWSFFHGVEFGYLLIGAFFKTLGLGYRSIFMFCSIVTFTFLYMAFKKLMKYPAIALFGFFTQYFTLPFVQMRFGTAAAISLYGLSFLSTGKKKQFWFFLLLALSFHISALGVIATYFFYKIDWLKKTHLIWIVLLVSCFVTLIPLRSILGPLMSNIGNGRYAVYINAGNVELRSLLYNLILLFPLILFRKELNKRRVNVNFFLSMGLASIFVGALVWQISILGRFSIINSMVLCMILPLYLLLIKYPSDRIIGFYFIALYSLLKFIPSIRWVDNYNSFIGNFL
jgi:hypothetical protein